MTPQLEKVFFNYILNNKKYYDVVKPYFFKNKEIQFVYNVIRDYMITNTDAEIPKPRQILDMVGLEDKNDMITKEILKSILQINLDEYSEKNFIIPKFNAWVLNNRLKSGTVDIIEETRNLDNIFDFEQTLSTATKIREIVDDMASLKFIKDDEDLGSDFDDYETHTQDNSILKVKTGFDTLDHMLSGGWDVSTLTIIMGSTGNGKCFLGDITVRNKNTKVIEKISISDFHERIKENIK